MRIDPAVPKPVLGAAIVVALEAVGLLVGAGFLVIDTVVGSPNNAGRALFAAAFAVAGAVVLALAARGLLRLRSAARSPIIVLELMQIAVAYGFFQAHREEFAWPVLIPALVVLYLLFTPPARKALDRDPTL